MPTIELYDTAAASGTWHHVASPGGYETLSFEVEAEPQLRIIATVGQGLPGDPGYQYRNARYRARPTKNLPPLPRDFPGAALTVIERDRVLSRFMTRVQPDEFRVSATEIRAGANQIHRDPDGTIRLRLRGTPSKVGWLGAALQPMETLTAEMTLEPVFASSPVDRKLDEAGAFHWISGFPVYRAEGKICLYGSMEPRVIRFTGRAIHEHEFATRNRTDGADKWMSGRAIFDDRVILFRQLSASSICASESIAGESKIIPSENIVIDGKGRTRCLLAYPKRLEFASCLLMSPRVVESAWSHVRVAYDADCAGSNGAALCMVEYPNRLRCAMAALIIGRGVQRH